MSTIRNIKQITLPINCDSRGSLVVVESSKNIPFEIKRVFYIFDTQTSDVRGQHANLISEFVMVCIAGSCKVKVIDTTGAEAVYVLKKLDNAIYVPKMTWKEMYNFSPDCVLLVIASTHYDSEEYIYDLDSFLKLKQ